MISTQEGEGSQGRGEPIVNRYSFKGYACGWISRAQAAQQNGTGPLSPAETEDIFYSGTFGDTAKVLDFVYRLGVVAFQADGRSRFVVPRESLEPLSVVLAAVEYSHPLGKKLRRAEVDVAIEKAIGFARGTPFEGKILLPKDRRPKTDATDSGNAGHTVFAADAISVRSLQEIAKQEDVVLQQQASTAVNVRDEDRTLDTQSIIDGIVDEQVRNVVSKYLLFVSGLSERVPLRRMIDEIGSLTNFDNNRREAFYHAVLRANAVQTSMEKRTLVVDRRVFFLLAAVAERSSNTDGQSTTTYWKALLVEVYRGLGESTLRNLFINIDGVAVAERIAKTEQKRLEAAAQTANEETALVSYRREEESSQPVVHKDDKPEGKKRGRKPREPKIIEIDQSVVIRRILGGLTEEQYEMLRGWDYQKVLSAFNFAKSKLTIGDEVDHRIIPDSVQNILMNVYNASKRLPPIRFEGLAAEGYLFMQISKVVGDERCAAVLRSYPNLYSLRRRLEQMALEAKR